MKFSIKPHSVGLFIGLFFFALIAACQPQNAPSTESTKQPEGSSKSGSAGEQVTGDQVTGEQGRSIEGVSTKEGSKGELSAAWSLLPPGAEVIPAGLISKIEALVQKRFPKTAPRTRHRDAKGRPLFANRLTLESSPYLLQHAHNPVNWYPWGDEAFEAARKLDRPVFLSVGYSTCHWCHVMEEESFEDLEIAKYINEHFIAIKVDREQRPDVDEIYMAAVRALTRRGGWPMTVVMTPDREPFFGATYIPPRSGARGSRQGLIEILTELQERYKNDREGVVSEAKSLSKRIGKMLQPARPEKVPGASSLASAASLYARRFDRKNGGLRGRHKFPTPSIYRFLLRYGRRSGDPNALEIITKTLEAIAEGGIHDHIAGGFHRYTTEETWLIPHFEKMLYDNAQLTSLFLEASQETGSLLLRETARRILDYVALEMTAKGGGFYSATDADSEGEEGLFFLWKIDELSKLLTPEETRFIVAFFNVTKRGNFEGQNILHTPKKIEDVAASLGLTEVRAQALLVSARSKLYAARLKRIPPGLDDKVLVAWNGLMISAFAHGALVLGDKKYAESAANAADFILKNMVVDGHLQRSFHDGNITQLAFLDDHAFFITGLLDLHEATQDVRWLREAIQLQKVLDAEFKDPLGGYFFKSNAHEVLISRQKSSYDGATPTGNSLAAENLLRLHELTGDQAYRKRAEGIFSAFGEVLRSNPTSLPRMLCALDFYLDRPREIVIISPPGASSEALDEVLRGIYLPNRVLLRAEDGAARAELEKLSPLLRLKTAIDGRATAYVCEAGLCERPTSDPKEFFQQLSKIEPYPSP